MLVGEPVEVADLLEAAQQQGWGEAALQVAIADRVGQVGGGGALRPWALAEGPRPALAGLGGPLRCVRCAGGAACTALQGAALPGIHSSPPPAPGTRPPCTASFPSSSPSHPQALYKLKAELDGLPLEAVAPQDPRAAALSISDDRLLPLIGAPCCEEAAGARGLHWGSQRRWLQPPTPGCAAGRYLPRTPTCRPP